MPTGLVIPSILEAAAFAVPCDDYGERVEACVCLKEKVSVELADLKSHCENQIGKYKCPDKIHIVADKNQHRLAFRLVIMPPKENQKR